MKQKHLSFSVKRRIIFSLCVVLFALLYAFKNTSFTVRALSTIGLLFVFYMADHLFVIHFKLRHYIFIILIAVSGFLLSPLYFVYPNYDKILHLALPVLYSSIVFYMISPLRLELKWKLTYTFFVVLGSLALFEIGEYLLDIFFDLKLQGVFLRSVQGLDKFDILVDRIDDTMIDLVLGVIGSGIYALYAFLVHRKSKRDGRLRR